MWWNQSLGVESGGAPPVWHRLFHSQKVMRGWSTTVTTISREDQEERRTIATGITVPCDRSDVDESLAKIYRFASILGWFAAGFVDVGGHVSGTHPILYGDPQNVYSSVGAAGSKGFSCNFMPVIRDEVTRNALAFFREGKRHKRVHDSYAFLSFYNVVESQFADGKAEGRWIDANLGTLTSERAVSRIADLRAAGTDVGRHLFESGRFAVAHASLDGAIADP